MIRTVPYYFDKGRTVEQPVFKLMRGFFNVKLSQSSFFFTPSNLFYDVLAREPFQTFL